MWHLSPRHMVDCFLWALCQLPCHSKSQRMKEASEYVQKLLSSLAWGGNILNLRTDCQKAMARYYSRWQDRVSRGWRGGVQNELRPGSLWHQRIADIILLLYPVCCRGLGEVWADLRGTGQNGCAAPHLHMRLFFVFFLLNEWQQLGTLRWFPPVWPRGTCRRWKL